MDLTEKHLLFMTALRDHKPETYGTWDMHEYGEKVGIGLDEVDQLAPELEEDGYIDRTANDVWLTDKGKKALKDGGK